MMEMVFRGFGVNEDVINVHDDKLVQKWREHIIHQVHEGGWGVGEAKRKDSKLKVTIAGAEGGLVHIVGVNANLMISRPQIEGSEDGGALELIQQLIDTREGVAVLDGDGIEGAVVDTHAKGAIFFAGEEDGGTKWRLGGHDPAFRKVVLQLTKDFLKLGG